GRGGAARHPHRSGAKPPRAHPSGPGGRDLPVLLRDRPHGGGDDARTRSADRLHPRRPDDGPDPVLPHDPDRCSGDGPRARPPLPDGPASDRQAGHRKPLARPDMTPARAASPAAPLARRIAARIAADGPMTLAEYMAICLSDPAHGYYMRGDPFGAAGDFVTAPEVSQMFGEILGAWAAHVWQLLRSEE